MILRAETRWKLRQFLRNEKGAIAIMAAVVATCGLGALALGIDTVTLYFERRKAQGAVDLAAIAAARDIGHAEEAAATTISDNKIPSVQNIAITRGHYTPDAARPASLRFTASETPFNAVRVNLTNQAPLYFGAGLAKKSSFEVKTEATAVSTAEAAFTIGSRLVALNGGVLNAILGAALGGNLSLTAMDYNNLAAFNVDLFKFSDALATASGNLGSYDQLATSQVSLSNVLNALISLAQTSPGTTGTQFALTSLKNQSNASSVKIPAGQMIQFGPGGYLAIGQGGGALSAQTSALSIINAAAAIANGQHQAEITTNISVSSLLTAQIGITVGERPQSSPWVKVGEAGASIYTAQTRIRLIVTVGGNGILSGANITLPIYIDVASGKATLTEVACGADPATDASVTIDVTPSVINAWIAQPSTNWTALTLPPAMQPASIVSMSALGASVTGRAQAQIANMQPTRVNFSWNEIASGQPKTVKTTDFTASLVSSLVNDLSLTASVGPLSLLSSSLVTTAVKATLLPLTPTLDSLLNGVLDSLGVGLGEADVWVNGVRCDGSALVN